MSYKVLLIAANNGLQLAEQEKVEISNLIVQHGRPCLEEVALAERSLDDIITKLGAIDDISIIHFSGHANGEKLWAGEGEAGDGSGFANMLKRQKNLRLVFLNGCSTDGMVEALLNAGVKTVIATRKAIGDQLAKQFALVFWNRLIAGDSLKEAYEFAVASVQFRAKFKHQQPIILVSRSDERGLVLKQEDRELPWSLYVNKKKQRVLKWRPDRGCKQWFWWLGGALGIILTISLMHIFNLKQQQQSNEKDKSEFDESKQSLLNPILEWKLKNEQLGKFKVGDKIENVLYINNRKDSLGHNRVNLEIYSLSSAISELNQSNLVLQAGESIQITIKFIADKRLIGEQADTIFLTSNSGANKRMIVYTFEVEKRKEDTSRIFTVPKFFCMDIPKLEVFLVYKNKEYKSRRDNGRLYIDIPQELIGGAPELFFGEDSDHIRINREGCIEIPTFIEEKYRAVEG